MKEKLIKTLLEVTTVEYSTTKVRNFTLELISPKVISVSEPEFLEAVAECMAEEKSSEYYILTATITSASEFHDTKHKNENPHLMYWASVENENGEISSIPAWKTLNGEVMSSVGELVGGSDEDLKPFTECPFDGYKITQPSNTQNKSEVVEDVKPETPRGVYPTEQVVARVAIIPKNGYPIIYMKGFEMLITSEKDIKEEIISRVSRMIFSGTGHEIILLNWKVCPLFRVDTYPEHVIDGIDKYEDVQMLNIFVEFVINGIKMCCIVNAPSSSKNLMVTYEYYCLQKISERFKIFNMKEANEKIKITNIEMRSSEVAELPIILE